ncbi:hypothetical protein [Streptomyces sp. SID10815]|uniref:hypothetical protein n=1 Tax=Streptomyces sp. SID10815 TaxID=2706027 RepID=UPI0013CA40AF|nr:hypothetical protein [Streptomyces sp. SID10815]NEA52519.1 hypothetical protein [Streptomyces sp. SID10815]
MRPEMLTAVSALAVAVVTAAGGVAMALIGRRQPRGQRRRDDFTAVTDRMDRKITRQGERIDELEAETERDRARITAQDFALRYIAGWARSLVGCMRAQQLEPPPPPQPVPEEVRPYLHDITS